MKQRTDVTYLIRRMLYAIVFIAAGLGAAFFLEYRLNYSRYAVFISISIVIALGVSMNLYNYFTVFFHEEDDALIITYGLFKKKIAIVYALIQRCVIKENAVDKLFKTKQISVFYPDFRGIITEQTLGLKAKYADLLSAHILKRMSGEESKFPVR